MKKNVLVSSNSLFNTFIAEIRNEEVQKDSMRFRKNLERIGEVFAYEISKTLEYKKKSIKTPLGVSDVRVIEQSPVLATILRAGLALHQGLLSYFDSSESAFVSAYRNTASDGSFEIKVEYLATPSLEGKTVILSDPMLATGRSMELAYKALLKNGTPSNLHVVAALASKPGVEYIEKCLPNNTTLWIGAVDDELTSKSYIVPGLGDAGDLAYGDKI
jgi:uracil phosphoribosyltransferase